MHFNWVYVASSKSERGIRVIERFIWAINCIKGAPTLKLCSFRHPNGTVVVVCAAHFVSIHLMPKGGKFTCLVIQEALRNLRSPFFQPLNKCFKAAIWLVLEIPPMALITNQKFSSEWLIDLRYCLILRLSGVYLKDDYQLPWSYVAFNIVKT